MAAKYSTRDEKCVVLRRGSYVIYIGGKDFSDVGYSGIFALYPWGYKAAILARVSPSTG